MRFPSLGQISINDPRKCHRILSASFYISSVIRFNIADRQECYTNYVVTCRLSTIPTYCNYSSPNSVKHISSLILGLRPTGITIFFVLRYLPDTWELAILLLSWIFFPQRSIFFEQLMQSSVGYSTACGLTNATYMWCISISRLLDNRVCFTLKHCSGNTLCSNWLFSCPNLVIISELSSHNIPAASWMASWWEPRLISRTQGNHSLENINLDRDMVWSLINHSWYVTNYNWPKRQTEFQYAFARRLTRYSSDETLAYLSVGQPLSAKH